MKFFMRYLPLFLFFPLSYRHDSRLWDFQITYELKIQVFVWEYILSTNQWLHAIRIIAGTSDPRILLLRIS